MSARLAAVVVVAIASSACIESGLSRCSDGRVCSLGFVCDDTLGCIDPAQACGNGRVERGEECDDGNLGNHDGCTSQCLGEMPVWTQISVTDSPRARRQHAMVFDALRGRMVMFGGSTQTAKLDETYLWDGASWQLVPATTKPGARTLHAMTYDAARGRTVLFGGVDPNNGHLADTWEFDGEIWTQAASTGPRGRRSAGLAYPDRVLLVGGEDGTTIIEDMWAWDGTQWTEQTTQGLVARREFAMTASGPSRMVLFGGISTERLADTWEWDGTAWSSIAVSNPPPPRRFAALVYDSTRRRVVLFGGLGDTSLNDTWEWDGTAWSPSAAGPTGRNSLGMAYDSLRREILVFGGQQSSAPASDTWRYRYERAGAPEESCVAGEDADGDGLVGCDDIDCWGYCTPLCPPGEACDPALPKCGDGVCNPHLETAACPTDC